MQKPDDDEPTKKEVQEIKRERKKISKGQTQKRDQEKWSE